MVQPGVRAQGGGRVVPGGGCPGRGWSLAPVGAGGAGAAVGGGGAVGGGDGEADAGAGAGGGEGGEGAAQGGVEGAEAVAFSGALGQAEQGGQRDDPVSGRGPRGGRPGGWPGGRRGRLGGRPVRRAGTGARAGAVRTRAVTGSGCDFGAVLVGGAEPGGGLPGRDPLLGADAVHQVEVGHRPELVRPQVCCDDVDLATWRRLRRSAATAWASQGTLRWVAVVVSPLSSRSSQLDTPAVRGRPWALA